MKVKVIKNFFSKDMMDLLKLQVDQFKTGDFAYIQEDREKFFRKAAHNPDLFRALHILMEKRANELFPEKVKPSYCFVSMYDDARSICPLHTDRPQCKYTIDLCINQNFVWPIYISDTRYSLEIGDAVIYSGTDHPHYRDQIGENNFCDLAFFHFVPENFQGEVN